MREPRYCKTLYEGIYQSGGDKVFSLMVLASPIKFCQGLCLVIFMGTSLVHVSKSSQYFFHRLSDFDLSNFLSDPGAGI